MTPEYIIIGIALFVLWRLGVDLNRKQPVKTPEERLSHDLREFIKHADKQSEK